MVLSGGDTKLPSGKVSHTMPQFFIWRIGKRNTFYFITTLALLARLRPGILALFVTEETQISSPWQTSVPWGGTPTTWIYCMEKKKVFICQRSLYLVFNLNKIIKHLCSFPLAPAGSRATHPVGRCPFSRLWGNGSWPGKVQYDGAVLGCHFLHGWGNCLRHNSFNGHQEDHLYSLNWRSHLWANSKGECKPLNVPIKQNRKTKFSSQKFNKKAYVDVIFVLIVVIFCTVCILPLTFSCSKIKQREYHYHTLPSLSVWNLKI